MCVSVQALSNQKYREMQEQFKDVGLMTGDVTINPSASCIVMTTEVGPVLSLLLAYVMSCECRCVWNCVAECLQITG